MIIRLLIAVLLVTAGCGTSSADAPTGAIQTGSDARRTETLTQRGPLDGLTITLQLEGSDVPSGGQVGASLYVRNDSGESVTDPGCFIASHRHALVPADDPDAELWLEKVVDCPGALKMPDGFAARYSGLTFPAATKYGEPLPPGDYIATLEIRGYSERLTQPAEVTD